MALGYRRRSPIQQVLEGLVTGAQAFGQGVAVQRQQDLQNREEQYARALEAKRLQEARQQAAERQTNDSYDRLQREYPGAFAELEAQRQGELSGTLLRGPRNAPAHTWRDTDPDAELESSAGTEGNAPATITGPGAGIDFGGKSASDLEKGRAVINHLLTRSGNHVHPAAGYDAVSKLANGYRLGKATRPGIDYFPPDGQPRPSTIYGLPTHVDPELPPNTVDLAEVIRAMGPVTWEQQAARALRSPEREPSGGESEGPDAPDGPNVTELLNAATRARLAGTGTGRPPGGLYGRLAAALHSARPVPGGASPETYAPPVTGGEKPPPLPGSGFQYHRSAVPPEQRGFQRASLVGDGPVGTAEARPRVYSLGRRLDYAGRSGIFNRDLFQAVRGYVKGGHQQEVYDWFGRAHRAEADAYIREAHQNLGGR